MTSLLVTFVRIQNELKQKPQHKKEKRQLENLST